MFWREESKKFNIMFLIIQAIKMKELKMVNVPKMEELSAKRLLLLAHEDAGIQKYLPDYQDGKSINQKFLYNVRFNF